MKKLGFIVFFLFSSAEASELTYGIEWQDSHVKVVIDFSKNTVSLPSTHLLYGKNQKKKRLGKFKVPATDSFLKLYKLLPLAFKKGSAFRGQYPPERPYLLYKGRLITSDSVFFKTVSNLFQSITDDRGKLIVGIEVEDNKGNFNIASFSAGEKSKKTKSVPIALVCRKQSVKKRLCRYKSYTWLHRG